MADVSEEYAQGFQAGFAMAMSMAGQKDPGMIPYTPSNTRSKIFTSTGKRRPASPKMKLLTKMTATKWAKYSKGNGKKSYVQIRAEVSRSQAYKKKCKGMK